MRSLGKCVTLFLAVLLIVFTTATPPVFGSDIKLVERIEFSSGESPQGPWAFCVTEDEIFIIPDPEIGNIKIYEKNGKFLILVKNIGWKGFARDELAKPTFCFYNRNESKFGVFDFEKREILIYDRIGWEEFELVHNIKCLRLGYDLHLSRDRLLISGAEIDQNEKPYHLYSVNLESEQKTFLLPTYYKYGFNSFDEFETEYIGKSDIKAVGVKGFFDIQGDYIYFVWEGDLKIIRVNINSKELTSFGEKTPHYIKPYASKRLLEARRNKDINIMRHERDRMSFVRDIFTTSDYVLVVYEGPVKQNQEKSSRFRLQFYELNGEFVKDVPIPGNPDNKMWFDKDRYILYSLCHQSQAEGKKEYFILRYSIE